MIQDLLPYWEPVVKTAIAIGGAVGFVIWIKSEILVLKNEVRRVIQHQEVFNESLKQLNNILTSIAVQDVRISMIEKDIDELRHGQGFISKP